MTEDRPLQFTLGVDIGDPEAWRRDHAVAYQEVLADMDARIAEEVEG